MSTSTPYIMIIMIMIMIISSFPHFRCIFSVHSSPLLFYIVEPSTFPLKFITIDKLHYFDATTPLFASTPGLTHHSLMVPALVGSRGRREILQLLSGTLRRQAFGEWRVSVDPRELEIAMS